MNPENYLIFERIFWACAGLSVGTAIQNIAIGGTSAFPAIVVATLSYAAADIMSREYAEARGVSA